MTKTPQMAGVLIKLPLGFSPLEWQSNDDVLN
jgi:hypothetical protein